MNGWLNALSGILAGAAGAMGIGGGSVLILALSLFTDMPQTDAQGINLLFFLPVALTGMLVYRKNHLICRSFAVRLAVGGVGGVVAGWALAQALDPSFLRKVFAVLLIVLSVRELFGPKKKEKKAP